MRAAGQALLLARELVRRGTRFSGVLIAVAVPRRLSGREMMDAMETGARRTAVGIAHRSISRAETLVIDALDGTRTTMALEDCGLVIAGGPDHETADVLARAVFRS